MSNHALKLAENAQARIAKVIELEEAGTCSLDTLHVARNDRDRALIALGREALTDLFQPPSQTAHPTEGEIRAAIEAFHVTLAYAEECEMPSISLTIYYAKTLLAALSNPQQGEPT